MTVGLAGMVFHALCVDHEGQRIDCRSNLVEALRQELECRAVFSVDQETVDKVDIAGSYQEVRSGSFVAAAEHNCIVAGH